MAQNLELTQAPVPADSPVRNNRPDSLSLSLGKPSISFRPPVHRKHDSQPPKGKSKAPPRTAYTDVPLRLFGSQSDPEDLLNQCSPTRTISSSSSQRPRSNASGHNMTSIEEEEYQEDVFLNNNRSNPQGGRNSGSVEGNSSSKVTMTGTIKRGKKQDVVRVSLSQHEVNALNRASKLDKDKQKRSKCGCRMGPHIFILSLLYIPIAFITSFIVSFYIGTMCWYNIYIFLSEEKSIVHKIFLCPLLIIFYPLLIVILTIFIALYSAVIQISWYFSSWYKEIKDFDKNFYGNLCEKLHVPQCSPYEVVIIDDNAEDGTLASQSAGSFLLQENTGTDPQNASTRDTELVDRPGNDGVDNDVRSQLLQQIRKNSNTAESNTPEGTDEVCVEIENNLDNAENSNNLVDNNVEEGVSDKTENIDRHDIDDVEVQTCDAEKLNGKYMSGDNSPEDSHPSNAINPESKAEFCVKDSNSEGGSRKRSGYENVDINIEETPQERETSEEKKRSVRANYDNWCVTDSTEEIKEVEEDSTRM